MHPRQASIINQARAVKAAIEGKKAAQAVLWQYADPDGNVFYLEVKQTSVKSPFSGKTFSTRPVRFTPAQVGQELKEEAKETKTAKIFNSQKELESYLKDHPESERSHHSVKSKGMGARNQVPSVNRNKQYG